MFCVKLFISQLKAEGIEVDSDRIEMPEPPDAIIPTTSGDRHWLEVRSAYRSKNLAKATNSRNVQEKPYTEYLGTIDDYNSNQADKIMKGIFEKDNKKNYKEILSTSGKGVLILYLDDPLCHPNNYEKIIQIVSAKLKIKAMNYFRLIYLAVRECQAFSEEVCIRTKSRLALLYKD